MIAPPYSSEFIQLFLPIVRNEEITGRLRSADHSDDVSLFLGEAFFNNLSWLINIFSLSLSVSQMHDVL